MDFITWFHFHFINVAGFGDHPRITVMFRIDVLEVHFYRGIIFL